MQMTKNRVWKSFSFQVKKKKKRFLVHFLSLLLAHAHDHGPTSRKLNFPPYSIFYFYLPVIFFPLEILDIWWNNDDVALVFHNYGFQVAKNLARDAILSCYSLTAITKRTNEANGPEIQLIYIALEMSTQIWIEMCRLKLCT